MLTTKQLATLEQCFTDDLATHFTALVSKGDKIALYDLSQAETAEGEAYRAWTTYNREVVKAEADKQAKQSLADAVVKAFTAFWSPKVTKGSVGFKTANLATLGQAKDIASAMAQQYSSNGKAVIENSGSYETTEGGLTRKMFVSCYRYDLNEVEITAGKLHAQEVKAKRTAKKAKAQ